MTGSVVVLLPEGLTLRLSWTRTPQDFCGPLSSSTVSCLSDALETAVQSLLVSCAMDGTDGNTSGNPRPSANGSPAQLRLWEQE